MRRSGGGRGLLRGRALLLDLRRCGCLAADRLLEAAHPRAQRAPELRQPLGAEHHQQDREQKREVDWIVEAHVCSDRSWVADRPTGASPIRITALREDLL